ncbi:MAG: hypothetical protein PHW04_10455 [Candidatus Wallbacteria bacterium]|nr:hypothetical protein [Candidatus Wallbacteria bacterium]
MEAVYSKYNYILEKAEDYFCVCAVLKTIIQIHSNRSISQQEIANFFNIIYPSDYPYISDKSITSKDPNDWGIKIHKDGINNLLKAGNIPLKENYYPINQFQDWQFDDKIREILGNGYHLVCGFCSPFLYFHEDKKVGHVAIIYGIENENVILLDPGPEKFGRQVVQSIDLYQAIHFKKDGIWEIIPKL